MNFKNTVAIIISFLVGFSSCLGQVNRSNTLVFNNVTEEDGLPNAYVNAIAEDKNGFIWVGTNDGLCRYDAHDKMRIFKSGDKNIERGLRSSHIMELYASPDNLLYIGTRQGGLSIYDLKNDTWETFTHNKNDPTTLSNDEVISILKDSKGRIWVGTEDGLNLFNEETKTFNRYKIEKNKPGKLGARAILSISEDNNGWIWVCTWDGGLYLLSINEQNEEILFKRFDIKTKNSHSKNVWKLFQDINDNYWIATHQGGLYLMTMPDHASPHTSDWNPKYYQYSYNQKDCNIPAYYISDILQDSDGSLWIATVNGLSIVPSDNIDQHFDHEIKETPHLEFNNHVFDPSKRTSILDNVTKKLFKDSNGTIWISSRSGLSRFNPLSNQFLEFQLYSNDNTLPNGQAYHITNKGTIWLAAGNEGLLEINLKTNSVETILKGVLRNEDIIRAIYSKNEHTVYIATNNSIILYNPISEKHQRFEFESNKAINANISPVIYMLEDHNANLWLCTEFGLMRLNLAEKTYYYYLNNPLDTNSIIDNSVTQIMQTKNHDLWLTTHNGLSKVIQQGDNISFKNYKASNSKDGLKSNRLTCMTSTNNVIYLGSVSGLLGYDIDKDKFLDFREGNQKLNINSLFVTERNEIWGSSTNKLFKFDPSSKKMIDFDYKDGASNSNYLHQASVSGKNGDLYFGHFKGFTKVNTTTHKTNTSPPIVSVTETSILSKDQKKQINVIHNNHIEVQPDHYTIEINFAALDYTRPEKLSFAYMLEGFDLDWKYIDKNESAIYTNLDHGKYTFKVKAANEVGIWNEEGASLDITVRPSFLETTLAKFLMLLLLSLFIYLAIKLYTNRIQERNKALKKYNDSLNKEIEERNKIEKTLQTTNEELKRSNSELEQFAYIASHDLQEPLRITGSFIDLLEKRYTDVLDDNAFKYIDFAKGGIGRMGLLIKNLLTFSKVGGTVLDFSEASLKHIVEEKLLDLARLIKNKNVTIDIGTLPTIVCEKNQMAMLFYNLINNAIKFNENPKPVVNISAQNSFDKDFYSFYVSDNGIGIDEQHQEKIFEIFKRLHDKDAYEGTGIGLALCKKIVTRHGGKIWVESKPDKGTTFYFTISKNLSNLNQVLPELPTKQLLKA